MSNIDIFHNSPSHEKHQNHLWDIKNQTAKWIQNILQKNHSENYILQNINSTDEKNIFQNLDSVAKEIFTHIPELKILYKGNFDGHTFYFTTPLGKAFNYNNGQIFFVEKNGKIEPRFARMSGSGKKYTVNPWFDSNHPGRISKGDTTWWLDYESGVIAHKIISHYLFALQEKHQQESISLKEDISSLLEKIGYTSKNYETKEALKEFQKINLSDSSQNEKNVYSLGIWALSYEKWGKKAKEEAKNNPQKWMQYIFENTPLDKIIFWDFLANNKKFIKWKTHVRKITSSPEKEIYEIIVGKFENKDVVATFALNVHETELPWLEKFEIRDDIITSYGIPKHRLSSGIFTAKPLEYMHQVPEFFHYQNLPRNGQYYDIRTLLQENPFIKAFKEIYPQIKKSYL